MMNEFDEAFIHSYTNNMGNCPRNIIECFLTDPDGDFHHVYKDHYSRLSDAYNIWKDAIYFGRSVE